MAVNNPSDLFLYELGALHDAERKSAEMLGSLAGKIRDGDLAQLLHKQEQESQQQLRNLDSCFQALGASPIHIRSTTIEGIRSGFEEFEGLQPTPDILELYTLGAAMRLAHFGIASYQGLVDRALLMDESRCAQCLQTNLIQKEESAGDLERVGHEMSQRILAAA